MFNRLRSWLGVRTGTPHAEVPRCKEGCRARLRLDELESRAVPAIIVTTGEDVVDATDKFTSLREAITTANNNGAGADTIVFQSVGTVTLTQDELLINSAITIDGGGLKVKIARSVSAGPFRIFDISSDGVASLLNLEITGGDADIGAGIKNNGTLTVTGCKLDLNEASNFGGAIYNGGSLAMTNCDVVENFADFAGGGIYNSGTADISGCSIMENGASAGAGIYTSSSEGTGVQLWVHGQSNVYLNQASTTGGGIYVTGSRGTIVEDSTVSGNHANQGGGFFVSGTGTLCVENTAIAGNFAAWGGGGAYLSAVSTTSFDVDCVFSGNFAPPGSGAGILKLAGASLTNFALMPPDQSVDTIP